ncbi:hypothetical protein ACVISU_002112 [Bradyrhizobium sp. USDA 4452]
MFDQGRGAMQMQSAFAALCDRKILQDLGLKRRAKSFGLTDSIVPGGGFKLRQRGDSKVLVKPQYLLRPQPGHRQHLEYAGGDLLAQLLQAWMAARPMKLGNDVGNGFANARNFGEPVLLDQRFEWDCERCDIVGGAGIGLGTVGIAAPHGGALRVLAQEFCYLLGLSDGHSAASRRPQSAPCGRADETHCSVPNLSPAISQASVPLGNRPCDAGSGRTRPPSSGGGILCLPRPGDASFFRAASPVPCRGLGWRGP